MRERKSKKKKIRKKTKKIAKEKKIRFPANADRNPIIVSFEQSNDGLRGIFSIAMNGKLLLC